MAGTNIFEHVSDDASTVEITGNTVFSSDNLQDALEEIKSHALTDIPTITQATTTTPGMVYLAPNSDYDSTDSTKAVTPAGLNYWIQNESAATETNYGLIKLVSQSDLNTANDDTKALTIAKFNDYMDIRSATEAQKGFAKISTVAQAETAIDDTTIMTPLKVKDSIAYWAITSDSTATTTNYGLIQIATDPEVEAGNNTTYCLTPNNINSRAATTSLRGAFELPTQTIADSRSSNDCAVTVGTLGMFEATPSLSGVCKLYNGLDSTATDSALTAAQGKILNDSKIGSTGGTITGELVVDNIKNSSDEYVMQNGDMTGFGMLGMYPVGSIYVSIDPTDPSNLFGGTWESFAAGRVLIGSGTGTDINSLQKTFAAGETGGEFSHANTLEEMTKHRHTMGWGEAYGGAAFGVNYSLGKGHMGSGKTDYDNYLYYTDWQGESKPHNNIQPYIVVYMFKRIA